MPRAERIVTELLARAGVGVNGEQPWDIRVLNTDFYGRILRDKSVGLGEAYMAGWWECDRLDELFSRICTLKLDTWSRADLSLLLDMGIERILNRQSRRNARIVAEKHYDLGNDMFLSWLDAHNQYSCAYFADTDDLDQAQRNKLELICKKIGLRPEDEVLDIGCGWGGFSAYAAERYGCSVTGANISRNQVDHVRRTSAERGLDVEVLCCDYRDLDKPFDKIVSIGMFEHVGLSNYRAFMHAAHRCLRDSGVFLLHTIGSNNSSVVCDAWIRKYIFPNGMVPSLAQISRAVEGLFIIEDVHNIGPHYDKTLMAWNERFQGAWPRLRARYSETFKRMWEYYLLSCAGVFRARDMQVWQIVLTKPGTAQPDCRVC